MIFIKTKLLPYSRIPGPQTLGIPNVILDIEKQILLHFFFRQVEYLGNIQNLGSSYLIYNMENIEFLMDIRNFEWNLQILKFQMQFANLHVSLRIIKWMLIFESSTNFEWNLHIFK